MRIAIFLVLASALGMGPQAPEGNIDNGRRVYDDRGCYQCHGYEGQGGAAGARLAPDPLAFAAFSRYVRQPSGQMPPYTTRVLSDEEMADIYAFLETIPDPPPVESIPQLND